MTDPWKNNDFKKLMELAERRGVVPGRVEEVDVYHDDWCGIYRGDYCDRDPEIEFRPVPEQN
jgi:hypothetical protein